MYQSNFSQGQIEAAVTANNDSPGMTLHDLQVAIIACEIALYPRDFLDGLEYVCGILQAYRTDRGTSDRIERLINELKIIGMTHPHWHMIRRFVYGSNPDSRMSDFTIHPTEGTSTNREDKIMAMYQKYEQIKVGSELLDYYSFKAAYTWNVARATLFRGKEPRWQVDEFTGRMIQRVQRTLLRWIMEAVPRKSVADLPKTYIMSPESIVPTSPLVPFISNNQSSTQAHPSRDPDESSRIQCERPEIQKLIPNQQLVNGEPRPRYGILGEGETVATFRYHFPISHLRSVGYEAFPKGQRNRSVCVVAMSRVHDEVFRSTFPEWIVTGIAIERRRPRGQIQLTMHNLDIEGREMPGLWPSAYCSCRHVSYADVCARGYFLPPFDRLQEGEFWIYLRHLFDHDQPPANLPSYVQ